MKKLIAAASAMALIAAPTVATAQKAPAAEVAPQTEQMEGSELRGGFILPLAVIVAIILGVLLLTKDEEQISP